MAGSSCLSSASDSLPDSFSELEIGYILREIIQSREKVPGIEKGGNCRTSEGRSGAKPLLLPEAYHNAIWCFLERHRDGRLSPRGGTGTGSDLKCHASSLP